MRLLQTRGRGSGEAKRFLAALCDRVMWLTDGELQGIGDTAKIVERYSLHLSHATA